MKRTHFSSAQVPPSPEEVSKILDAGLPGADLSRSAGLQQLSQVRDAKARSLSREQTLLTLKHGGAEHARIAESRQRFAVNEQFRREIAVIQELAETPAPDVGKDAMIVHGFVRRRSDHAGLPGLTIALTDADGNWMREFGYACTDKRGYFLLEIKARGATQPNPNEKPGDIKSPTGISVEEAKREAEAKAAAAAAAAAAGRTESATASANIPTSRALQLRVFDSQGRSLHVESRPVVLALGAIDYRYILLGDEEAQCACMPPPAKSGGKPATTGPKVTPNSPPPANVATTATPAPSEPRVTGLKQYEQPAAGGGTGTGVPLEAIRGIGPKSAEKLREAGITDVSDFVATPGAEFVKLSGFDKTAPKSATTETKPKSEPVPEKRTAVKKKTATRKAAPKKKKEK